MDNKFRKELEQEFEVLEVNDMDVYDKRRLKSIKERAVAILESGHVTDPNAQYELVNSAVVDILQFKDKVVCDEIIKYLDDQDKLKKQIEDKQKELQKLMDEYGDNAKDIYEMIKKI